jgi:hypothetical protein
MRKNKEDECGKKKQKSIIGTLLSRPGIMKTEQRRCRRIFWYDSEVFLQFWILLKK